MENVRNIIESLLFVSDTPLTIDKLKTVLETVDAKEIRDNLNALADYYEARGGGFRLCEVAGGWQLRTRSRYHEYIKRMLQPAPQRLSRAALETLAIVAYNQPIIRADIEHIRGVDCGGMLRQLLERKLIRVLGRKEMPGRPLIYATSKLFLELFELKNLKDLPTPKEIEEMGTMAANEAGKPATNSHGGTAPIPSGMLNTPNAIPPNRPPGSQPFRQTSVSKVHAITQGPARETVHGPKTVHQLIHMAVGCSPASTQPHQMNPLPSKISSPAADIASKAAKIHNRVAPLPSQQAFR